MQRYLPNWAATGPTSAIVTSQSLLGWQYNIGNVDDVQQITFTIGRVDDAQRIQDSLARGKAVWNYGALLMGRWQDWDLTYNPRPTSPILGGGGGDPDSATGLDRDQETSLLDQLLGGR